MHSPNSGHTPGGIFLSNSFSVLEAAQAIVFAGSSRNALKSESLMLFKLFEDA